MFEINITLNSYWTSFIMWYSDIQNPAGPRLRLQVITVTQRDSSTVTVLQHMICYILIERENDLSSLFNILCSLVVSIWVDLSMKFYQRLPMIIHLSTSKFTSNFVKMTLFNIKMTFCHMKTSKYVNKTFQWL